MPLSSLLGNRRIKDNLTNALKQGKPAHFYLISGPTGSGKRTLARLLAAAAMCEGDEKPCGRCRPCRKVLGGVHPDVITVEDPEHKTVPVRIIRQMREDVFIKPNEGEKKVYIFPQEIGLEGQNALLKILEEPPAYGMFLLLAENPEKILPTVRSRCVELKMQGLDADVMMEALKKDFPQAQAQSLQAAIERSGGFLGQAKALLEQGAAPNAETVEFVRSFCEKDALGLTKTLVPMEKLKRDGLIETLGQWTEIMEGALVVRHGGQSPSPLSNELARCRKPDELNRAVTLLKKAAVYAAGNVSPAAICGYLSWALR